MKKFNGDVPDHSCPAQCAAGCDALEPGKTLPLTRLDDAGKTREVIFAADESAAPGRLVKRAGLK